MKPLMNDYPEGATWVAKNDIGECRIWLEYKNAKKEHWYWSFQWAGSHDVVSDWGTTYQNVYNECPNSRLRKNDKIPRFKRIK